MAKRKCTGKSLAIPLCGISSSREKKLSLSKCKFGKHFTCDTGVCIDIKGRCNRINDCADGSDEHDCEQIQFSGNYKEIQPPKTLNVSEATGIITFIKIESIDFIDTIKMQVGLTLEVNQKWTDSRLTFANLKNEGTN